MNENIQEQPMLIKGTPALAAMGFLGRMASDIRIGDSVKEIGFIQFPERDNMTSTYVAPSKDFWSKFSEPVETKPIPVNFDDPEDYAMDISYAKNLLDNLLYAIEEMEEQGKIEFTMELN